KICSEVTGRAWLLSLASNSRSLERRSRRGSGFRRAGPLPQTLRRGETPIGLGRASSTGRLARRGPLVVGARVLCHNRTPNLCEAKGHLLHFIETRDIVGKDFVVDSGIQVG